MENGIFFYGYYSQVGSKNYTIEGDHYYHIGIAIFMVTVVYLAISAILVLIKYDFKINFI